jgi:hypothetical protein
MLSKVRLTACGDNVFNVVLTDDVLGDLPDLGGIGAKDIIAYLKGSEGVDCNFKIDASRVVLDDELFEPELCRFENRPYLVRDKVWVPQDSVGPRPNVTFDQMRFVFDVLTDEIRSMTDNVYCCSYVSDKYISHGSRQMMDYREIAHTGFIVSVPDGAVTYGVEELVRVNKGLHRDDLEYKNTGSVSIRSSKVLSMLSGLSVNRIIFREPLDDSRDDGEALIFVSESVMCVCVKLDPVLVKNFDKHYTSRTDWSSIPLSDFDC